MTADPRIDAVAAGYDRLAERFAAWSAGLPHEGRSRYLDMLDERVPAGARILDLGCGQGLERLYRRYEATGVDVSAAQIARARERWPQARFLHSDMLEAELADGGFDAVVALYSLIHIPHEFHRDAWRRIARWLRPGGWFTGSFGVRQNDGEQWEWLGAQMFWSHPDRATTLALAAESGLRVECDELITELEDGEPVEFLWLLGRRSAVS
jgi:SAM-dependent methyltransferase